MKSLIEILIIIILLASAQAYDFHNSTEYRIANNSFSITSAKNRVVCPLCCKISIKSHVKSRRAVNEITASYFFTRFNN